jgi:hypothetical protein
MEPGMNRARKRRVKWFKRRRKNKTYAYAYVGYDARNEKGTPVFVREASLTGLPQETVEAIDRALRGEGEAPVADAPALFIDSIDIGATWCGLRVAEDLGITAALARHLSPPFDQAIMAMILDRVINPKPHSKRALADSFSSSALARICPPAEPIPLHQWYHALGLLYEQQEKIEQELASEITDRVFLYDITSSYFEGQCCPLAAWGYNRDGKKGKRQIVIGLLTNSQGRPLAVKVFRGNTKDETTVAEQMARIKDDLGVEEFIFVGDRGMLTSSVRNDIDADARRLIDYVTALTRKEIMALVEDDDHPLQLGLFDQDNLVEVCENGQRYVLCHTPEKADEDRRTRERLLTLTEAKLQSVQRNVEGGRYKREQVIAARLHRWYNHWGMAQFFEVDYGEGRFEYRRNEEKIEQSSNLDGAYVITTTVDAERMDTQQTLDCYKSLARVEKAWRMMKTADEFIRPIRHWNPDRVCGHVFVCMLAYLVIWESRRCFQSFLERDEDRTCEGDSLREIWERLDAEIKIGTLSLGDERVDQLKPMGSFARRLLGAANASISRQEKERLQVA